MMVDIDRKVVYNSDGNVDKVSNGLLANVGTHVTHVKEGGW